MLRTLSIRNFAIIDRLDLEFAEGFNVLTGETGAGKSIIMDALNLILGGRAGMEMVRTGTEKAVIDAVFDLTRSPDVQQFATDQGFEVEDNLLFLTREVHASGKSSCRVMGRPATVAQLRDIGDGLVDLHGQHEHQSLLATARHIDMLDEWGGKEIHSLRTETAQCYHALQALQREREALERDARERTHLLDLYGFQVKEIEDAQLTIEEEETLEQDHRRMANAHRLAESAAAATTLLTGSSEGQSVLDSVARVIRILEDAAQLDNTLSPSLEAIRNASYELIEAERDLTRYQDEIEFDPERLTVLEERRELLHTLKRKYGDTVEEILQYAAQTAEKRDSLTHSEERGTQLESEIAKTQKQLRSLCTALSKQRRQYAERFQQITQSELLDLGMEKTRFAVSQEPIEPTTRGADKVEFLIATNPGDPLRPLTKIASGGEISRVMLAIKSAMARREALPTMVFDEIDVGVGGRTASVIAEKMRSLSLHTQILCITHLAQIACQGTHHFYIEKQTQGEAVRVQVVPLSEEERVTEIARMVGGNNITDTVLQHAREMLKREVST